MNPKIFVGIAIIGIIGVIAAVGLTGTSVVSDVSDNTSFLNNSGNSEILPLRIQLDDIIIEEVDEKAAFVKVTFKVTNPNQKSILLQLVRYTLYEDDLKLGIRDVGDRDVGMVAGSNYFTVLNDRPLILSDHVVIKNTGNTPELWDALTTNTPEWRISGDAFYNLSSMTAGGENELAFEFTKQT